MDQTRPAIAAVDPVAFAPDVVVIGAGHAGIEAAAAAARLGCRVLVVTQRLDAVGRMSCNPSIGGLAKGQLVREVDAFGGLMGKIADETGVQFRILNQSKGPAVRAPRAQADREKYAVVAGEMLAAVENVALHQAEVARLVVEEIPVHRRVVRETASRLVAVETSDGVRIPCGAVILCAGTFMRGLLHCGRDKSPGGRHGDKPAFDISEFLQSHGFDLRRLKTGTSPRIDLTTIDTAGLDRQPGDEPAQPFSFERDPATFRPRQLECFVTHTTPATHEIIRENLHLAPMYAGEIDGSGPRYCPSIEDKVVRFADKDSHQVFVEPEGFETNVTYLAGLSTSLPAELQLPLIRTLPGFEKAEILRPGYAVEYDFLPAYQVDRGLQAHKIAGFFLAGQILGTSGYEEAAGQGLMAGLNAALWLGGRAEPFALGRDEAYIGVMIDDLITKVPTEPYRMFTSRAEHRLLLRADNADRRLTPRAAELGAVTTTRAQAVAELEAQITAAKAALAAVREKGKSLLEVLRRPEVTLKQLLEQHPTLQQNTGVTWSERVVEQVEIDGKYAGYLEIQQQHIERHREMETTPIPRDFDYATINGLRNEARERLSAVRPDNLGQATRIAGVTPSDVAQVMIALRTGDAVPAAGA